MKSSLLLKKIYLDEKEFISSDELKKYCNKFNMSYEDIIRYFIRRGYLIRIFKGIFYVKTLNEIKLGKTNYNHLELLSKGLEMKGVKNWYFGLNSALKLNNMTHEEFTIDHIINDRLFRGKVIEIVGYKFRFHKVSTDLLKFGIIKEGKIRYSDPEKTILDFLYLKRYNGVPEEKIIMDAADYTNNISREKIREYVKYYPKTVEKTLKVLL
jgi:predicted transcriptional regulator of viral defense system